MQTLAVSRRAGRAVTLAVIAALCVTACDNVDLSALPGSLPACDSAREVEGWTVTAGLEKTSSETVFVQKWEARRNYSTHFGIRITYDTGERPEPYLQIWHNYKTGGFAMPLADGAQLTTRLNANYAVTPTVLRPIDFDYLKSQPVRIEHTTHDGKWRVYETDGLPEAIAAGETDLAEANRKLTDRECAA